MIDDLHPHDHHHHNDSIDRPIRKRYINYKSDFVLLETLTDLDGLPVDISVGDFTIKYTCGNETYIASRVDGEYTNCSLGSANNLILVSFVRHHLACGNLQVEINAEIPDENLPNGVRNYTQNKETNIILSGIGFDEYILELDDTIILSLDKIYKGAKGDTGLQGIGISDITKTGTEITVTLTDNSKKYFTVQNGENGIGITSAEIVEDELIFTFSDSSTINVGKVIGASVYSIELDENNHLICTLTDNRILDAGEIKINTGLPQAPEDALGITLDVTTPEYQVTIETAENIKVTDNYEGTIKLTPLLESKAIIAYFPNTNTKTTEINVYDVENNNIATYPYAPGTISSLFYTIEEGWVVTPIVSTNINDVYTYDPVTKRAVIKPDGDYEAFVAAEYGFGNFMYKFYKTYMQVALNGGSPNIYISELMFKLIHRSQEFLTANDTTTALAAIVDNVRRVLLEGGKASDNLKTYTRVNLNDGWLLQAGYGAKGTGTYTPPVQTPNIVDATKEGYFYLYDFMKRKVIGINPTDLSIDFYYKDVAYFSLNANNTFTFYKNGSFPTITTNKLRGNTEFNNNTTTSATINSTNNYNITINPTGIIADYNFSLTINPDYSCVYNAVLINASAYNLNLLFEMLPDISIINRIDAADLIIASAGILVIEIKVIGNYIIIKKL